MAFGWFPRNTGRPEVVPKTQAEPVSIILAQLAAAHAASLPPKREPERKSLEDPAIEITRLRFIVFRQVFPPPQDPGRSFYGGAPVGPAGMEWPRGEDGKPLTFVMQWDAAALAAEDATGLLPRDGALHLFSNFGFGKSLDFRFVHVGGDGPDWAPLPEPGDLPPIFEAVACPAGAAVAQDRADVIWGRIERFEPIFWPGFAHVVDEAINLSFGLGSAGTAAIPAQFAEACAQRHPLAILSFRDERAHEFDRDRDRALSDKELFALYEQVKAAGELKRVRDVWAPPPNRMFGPPRYVQGDVEEFVDDWLLLLEVGSSDSIGWNIGDGVLQFLIRPEDLRARRFDRMEGIRTGY